MFTSDEVCCEPSHVERQKLNRESMNSLGSEFSWEGFPSHPFLPWPTPNSFFALGRHAIDAVCKIVSKATSRLFVPSYFCPQVTNSLANSGTAIATYEDLPTNPHPDWASLDAKAGDVVLAMNYFGVRGGDCWRSWREQHPLVILIEDHTHDPLSTWARFSSADFAFASLRKVLPVPDGAILWSPRGRSLPDSRMVGDWRGSALKLAGMIWKRSSGPHDTYRRFETCGEQLLEGAGGPAITPWSYALLEPGYSRPWRETREENVRCFLKCLDEQLAHVTLLKPLFTCWPSGACPFNPVLLFANEDDREFVRNGLIRQRVFTPVHWRLDASQEGPAAHVARRILTIPLDHRCRPEWMPQLVERIKEILDLRLVRPKEG